jgi:hypothetical protein
MKTPCLFRLLLLIPWFLVSQHVVASENDEWTFEATPYFMAAGLKGDVGIRNVEAEVDMSFGDIMDTLDFAFMGLVTAQKDRWTFGLEAIYFKISDDADLSGPFGRLNAAVDLTTEMSVYAATAAYRVIDDETKLNVLGGLRYTKVEADADAVITGAGPLGFARTLDAQGDESWTDAFIGASITHPVSDNVDLFGYFDVGGSSGSDTYQVIAGVNWEFKEDYTAKFGYRMLDWDYEDGGFKWDMKAYGPYAGLGIRF